MNADRWYVLDGKTGESVGHRWHTIGSFIGPNGSHFKFRINDFGGLHSDLCGADESIF